MSSSSSGDLNIYQKFESIVSDYQGFGNPEYDNLNNNEVNGRMYETLSSTSLALSAKVLNHAEIEVGYVVGEGSFGKVQMGLWRGTKVALKYVKLNNQESSNGIQQFYCEVQTMEKVCNHAHIVQFIGIVLLPFRSIVSVYYTNGSLYDLLFNTKKTLVASLIFQYALETALGMHHLHMEDILHGDLATRNLLIDDTNHIRITDFGFSRNKAKITNSNNSINELIAIRWAAPEVLQTGTFSEMSDVFSFGVVLYEMFAVKIPWVDYNISEVMTKVCSGERMIVPDSVSSLAVRLMAQCWHPAAASRINFLDIITVLKEALAAECPVEENVCCIEVKDSLRLPSQQRQDEMNEKVLELDEDDRQFFILFDSKHHRLCSIAWEHATLLRGIFVFLQLKGRNSKSVNEALELLRHFQKDRFHMTVNYFWIQLLTLHMAVVRQLTGKQTEPFKEFINRPQCNQLLDPLLPLTYYSPTRLENGAFVFLLPDLLPLPNLLPAPCADRQL